jgi:hypothetical protein
MNHADTVQPSQELKLDGDGHKSQPNSRSRLLDDIYPGIQPLAQAVTARTAYLAASGRLAIDDAHVENALRNIKSPTATQLIGRMQLLREQGWDIRKTYEPVIGIENAYYQPKTIHYEAPYTERFASILGGPDATKLAALNLASKLAHQDGHVRYITDPSHGEMNQAMAERILKTHANSRVVTAHLTDAAGLAPYEVPQVAQTLEALRKNSLGNEIYLQLTKDQPFSVGKDQQYAGHPNQRYRYSEVANPELHYITEKEARGVVNRFLSDSYGINPIDAETGKIKPLYIDAGADKRNTVTGLTQDAARDVAERDAQYVKYNLGEAHRSELKSGYGAEVRNGLHMSPQSAMYNTTRGLQTLAAVGAMTAVGDVGNRFGASTGAGTGRLAKIGVNWGTFEAASFVTQRMIGSRLGGGARLAASLGIGGVAAFAADHLVGEHLETYLTDEVNGLLRI